jgi:hypothetical protein
MKVYVVEVGAYSNRYIDAIFARREDAEEYVISVARRTWHLYTNGRPLPDPTGREFGDWYGEVERLTGSWGRFGDVEEYDVHDSVPVVPFAE